MLKTEAIDRGFQCLPRDLETFMYWKIMFDRSNCINSTKYLLKFGKNMDTIFYHRLAVIERVHIFLVSVYLARRHQESQGGCVHSMFRK